jgi:ABC-type transporter Mla subunit MlaD
VQSTITGATWLNIDNLGAGEPATESSPLTGRPSGITRLLATLDEVTPELKATVTTAKETIGGFKPVGPKVAGLVDDVRTRTLPKVDHTVDRGGEALANIRDIAGDTKTDFRETMANVRSATGDLKDKLPGITGKLDGALAKVNNSLETAQGALTEAKETITGARGLIVGNRGRLETLIKSLKTTGDNLEGASAEIRRSPWRLLYKPGKDEVANLNLYDAARQFADGAEDVSDASLALRDALADPTADKQHVEKLMQQLEQTFGNFKQVEGKLWQAARE